MASVGQRNTKPELILRRVLHRSGLRYRLHDKKLPGTPDIVMSRFRAVIFVHGCFWHSHSGCKLSKRPSSRRPFWHKKLDANQARDVRTREALLASGWRVLIVWQCAIEGKGVSLDELTGKIVNWLESWGRFAEL
jgi:DNA mismatch endonuclease (patch repair protein)